MIKTEVSIVPPGGGEQDYSMVLQFPALPREGDYLSVRKRPVEDLDPADVGNSDFIVRRVGWIGTFPAPRSVDDQPVGKCSAVIECEYAIGPFSSEAHKKNAFMHSDHRGKPKPKSFEASGY